MSNEVYIKARAASTPAGDVWVRNPDWLDMPTINIGDEKFAGLYAVYENTVNELVIALGGNGGHVVTWGDGSSQVTLNNVEYVKAYDYATLSGSISIDKYGRNYKQVMVEITFNGAATTVYLDRDKPEIEYILGWLDMLASIPTTTTLQINQDRKSTQLERVRILDSAISQLNSVFQYTTSLRVWDAVYGNAGNMQGTFTGVGDVRDSNNDGLDITLSTITQMNSTFQNSQLTEFGNISTTSLLTASSTFNGSRALTSVGTINIPVATGMASMFNSCYVIRSIGTITTSSSLTSINSAFLFCYELESIEITDCSSVTNTTNAFLNCYSLESCILTGLTRTITVSNGRMNATSLDALMTSLGTAAGAQTLNISGHPGSLTATVSIATGKGWTVVTA